MQPNMLETTLADHTQILLPRVSTSAQTQCSGKVGQPTSTHRLKPLILLQTVPGMRRVAKESKPTHRWIAPGCTLLSTPLQLPASAAVILSLGLVHIVASFGTTVSSNNIGTYTTLHPHQVSLVEPPLNGSVQPFCHRGACSFSGHRHAQQLVHCLFQPIGIGAAARSSMRCSSSCSSRIPAHAECVTLCYFS